MAQSSSPRDPESDLARPSPPAMPRWVKVTGIVVGILVLVFLILQLTGIAGQHGPGRHMSGDGSSSSGSATAWASAGITVE